jgi:hypothetical protein
VDSQLHEWRAILADLESTCVGMDGEGAFVLVVWSNI